MHPIELTVEIISSLGVLIGIGILLNTLIISFKDTWARIIKSMATWLTVLTIIACVLASKFENFFFGFPAVPLLIAAFAILLISRKLTIISVHEKSKWISILLAILWGAWSSFIYFRLIIIIIPDYPTLYEMQGQVHWGYGVMLIGFAFWESFFSIIINLVIAIKANRKSKRRNK